MIAMLDSSFDRPTTAQARAALEAGIGAWGGYLVSVSDDVVLAFRNVGQGMFGLAAPWTTAEFRAVQNGGLRAVAFLSGNDTPHVADKARALGLVSILDDEEGIRPRGAWEQPWLDESGAGLYGLCAVHELAASRRIVARYPRFDPGATWDRSCSAPPVEPHGWQWAGTATDPVTGLSVDRSWLTDDFFGEDMTPEQAAQLQRIYEVVETIPTGRAGGNVGDLAANIYQQLRSLDGLSVPGGAATILSLLLEAAQDLTDLKAAVARIEAALRGA